MLENGHVMSHDYSHESTEEDPRMIAFFDSLVQRELEGISSDDSLSSNEDALFSRIFQLSQSDIDSDDSLNEPLEQNSDDEPNFSPFTIAFASVMASQAAEGNDRYPRLNNALNDTGRRQQDSTSTRNLSNSSSESQHTDGTRGMQDISRLVQKKKLELRQSIHRKLKDCSAKLSSSSSVDVSESDDDSASDLDKKDVTAKVTNKDEEIVERSENNLAEMAKQMWEKEKEYKKLSQVKLKKLRHLRQSVLQSDSETSDTEKKEKKLDIHYLSSTPVSSLNSNDEPVEKVTFKKLKKRASDSLADDEKDKRRSSPDSGPYLQRAGPCNCTVEMKKTVEDQDWKKGKKIPEESVTGKGKVKHNSDFEHEHGYNDRRNIFEENTESSLSSHDKKCKCEETCTLNSKDTCSIETSGNEMKSENHMEKIELIHDSDRHCDSFKKKKSSKIVFNRNVNRSGITRRRSVSPTTSEMQQHSEKRCVKDTDELDSKVKQRNKDNIQKIPTDPHTNNVNDADSSDDEAPSCSYRGRKQKGNLETRKEIRKQNHVITSDSEDENRSSKPGKRREDSSEDDQPTWSEFKRFRNRLERARLRYREHKKHKKQRRSSEDR